MRIVAPSALGSACKKFLPQSETDHRYGVAARRSPARCVNIIPSGKSASEHRLRAQYREKVRGCLDDMRLAPFTGSAQIRLDLFEDRGVAKIRAPAAPLLELLRAVVRLKK